MATIKYEIKGKSENTSIYLRLSVKRGVLLYRKTGLSINPKEWSEKTQLPKQTSVSNKNLTTRLRKLSLFVFDKLNQAEGETINGDWLFHKIEVFFGRVSENGKSELVTDAIQKIIDEAPFRDNGKSGIGLSKGRTKGYGRLKALFIEFQGSKKYKIKELNKNKFNEFKRWLLDENKYSASYTIKRLTDLKTVCKDARSYGIETSTELIDLKIKHAKTYDDDMDVIYLSLEEIEQIENIKLTNEALINARKWLILACFTGQRGQALTTRLNESSFEKKDDRLLINLRQKKGNKSVIIPTHPKVVEIYENGLPHTISTQKLNKHFKELGKLANLTEMIMGRLQELDSTGKMRGIKKLRPKFQYISTHIGRRSFACNHYKKLHTATIMKVTGHTKESTFLMYINQSDDNHIDEFQKYYDSQETKSNKTKSTKKCLKQPIK